MKLLCVNAVGTKGYLQNGSIYDVPLRRPLPMFVEISGMSYLMDRFQVMEEPDTDNTLARKELDQHGDKTPSSEGKDT